MYDVPSRPAVTGRLSGIQDKIRLIHFINVLERSFPYPNSAMINEICIAELISSRICDVLATPVGAIGNGMELIEEFEYSMQDEAVDLLFMSATRSTNQIKFFRMVYGSAGYDGLGKPSSPMASTSTT